MIKSVLTAIPLYYLSMFKAPVAIIKEINRIQRNFLWEARGEEKKVAWIKWELCCNAKENGGLGVKNIDKFNKALVAKWVWRALTEKNRFWVKVVEAKYGRMEDWVFTVGRKKGSVWWEDLRKLC